MTTTSIDHDSDRLISLRTAGAILGLSTRAMRERIAGGQLRAYRTSPSSQLRVYEREVRALITPATTTAPSYARRNAAAKAARAAKD